ncbi:LacI family DNA-binding transcriptional regulator [Caenimonas aquaedulcis]|uniref:LacI family DNA-binding transcriptional regulator n=1 Tax=Caenimonas aquaedulcis TaxID=2793270 RepID=A0A931H427_9BURK|nr:LacI family DNA-binding transcriptional regulator [Caenimonas aquaedulcis]MBG9388239.1 LacI family DNA-binding transcriptional regulator [Caenimonas aquaedulcis]
MDQRNATNRPGAKHVALLAGVSTATVSRALNSPGAVDPATLQRVRDAVAQLRYVPHGAARSLRSQRSRMVGAIVPSFDYALYAKTTSALQQHLSAQGYSVVLAEHHYDLEQELHVARQLVEHGVDAFMLVGIDHDPRLFDLLDEHRRPFVLTWGVDTTGRHPYIGFDNRAAAQEVARHVISLGHERIGIVSAPVEGNDRGRERLAGFRAAIAQAGLKEPQVEHARIALHDAAAAMKKLLARKPRPTAVLATNDVLAVGAMMACRAAGISIPDDVAITGIDNTDLGATQTPGLTSVRTPIVEIGEAAAEQLVALIEGRGEARSRVMEFELVVRDSARRRLRRKDG